VTELVRALSKHLRDALAEAPAVALLGPRQVGKTTLALSLMDQRKVIYLDLQAPADIAKLSDPELYLTDHQDKLVILDEIHRLPSIFPVLRGLIDRARRAGKRTGLYLILGSASPELLKQSGETLAGRVRYLELTPLCMLELAPKDADRLWVRGGFPDSFLAVSSAASMAWRVDFIRSYLERDIPQFGPRISATVLRRFWTMLAHTQGGLLNAAALARSLTADQKTIANYLDLLTDLFLLRRLPPWHGNVGKRLVKSPKIYVRDSGVLHALLGIGDKEALLGHAISGASYEGFVIETLLSQAPAHCTAYFYRTSAGAEIDLLLAWSETEFWAIEIKRSLDPKPRRGFYHARQDINPSRSFVVYPGAERYRISEEIEAIPVSMLAAEIAQQIIS
jgi:uncharacterized protein